MIPFNLHRRLPLVRIPFDQRDHAIAQRDAALAKLAALLQERQQTNGSKPLAETPAAAPDRHHLLLACMPKSGSSFLHTILGSLPNFTQAALVSNFGRREQELDPVMLWLNADKHYVAKHNVRYSEATRDLIARYKLDPIVLVRDVFDVTVSLRDHLRNRSVIAPMAYIFPEFVKWDDAKLEEFIADMMIPWYFNFYISWHETDRKLLVTYNELNRDPFAVLSRIKSRYRLDCTDDDIRAAIKKSQGKDQALVTEMNKAIVGRGKNLSEKARQHILRMASYYEGRIDFKPIGIGA